eukprot:COSAG02_NODE_1869_length_10591_cov_184.261056_5_plen_73_part_00
MDDGCGVRIVEGEPGGGRRAKWSATRRCEALMRLLAARCCCCCGCCCGLRCGLTGILVLFAQRELCGHDGRG